VDDLSGDLADAQDPKTEAVHDIVNGLLDGGDNTTLTYDDTNDILTIDTSGMSEEQVEDTVASLITGDSNISVNYDDANDNLALGLSGPITGVQIGTSSNPVEGYFSSANIDDELTVGRTIDAGTSITVSRDESMIVAGDHTTDGVLTVDGVMEVIQ